MKRSKILAIQSADVVIGVVVCAYIYYRTGLLWVALTCWLLSFWSVVFGHMIALLDLPNTRTHTITVTPRDIKQMLTMRVKISPIIGPRMWLGAKVIAFAAWIISVGLDIKVEDSGKPT